MAISALSYRLVLSKADAPILEPVTKLGGQPVWVDEPQWPLSTELGTPMMFLGQFRLPGEEVRMAYLFMTDDEEDHVDGTWESEQGENALIVQPGRVPSFITVTDDAEGPTMSEDLAVELVPASPAELEEGWDNRLGGSPTWVQGEEYPPGDWSFLLQLNDGGEFYGVNFGDAGVGYGFLSADGREGRFLWQCS
ncbi:hypothetical protein ACFOWE_32020 [Planomonospora corallina]|uniref:DUF1963 domain-containing protein n=1 Tax=Planomonospora corallina TaxID=1806052 RepID=A0ABV8IFQ1_9ACTN